ncbi:MAG: DUF2318 domain-containing protein [Deferribacteraceae bacterium]|jgi:uncharacterized membrane protein|nr:DUF2318 domain-containing protein [Deferribacteraceae bacterium]
MRHLLLVLAIFFAFFTALYAKSMPKAYEATVKVIDGKEYFVFPVSDFDDGQARYYSMKLKDKTVRYFLVKAKDGVVRAAFDACDVCYEAKKGYQQNGDIMICINCGRKFRLDKINILTGGCNPAALTRKVKDNMILIDKNDVATGAFYF